MLLGWFSKFFMLSVIMIEWRVSKYQSSAWHKEYPIIPTMIFYKSSDIILLVSFIHAIV